MPKQFNWVPSSQNSSCQPTNIDCDWPFVGATGSGATGLTGATGASGLRGTTGFTGATGALIIDIAPII